MLPCCSRQPPRQSWALPIRLLPSEWMRSAPVLVAKQLLRSRLGALRPGRSVIRFVYLNPTIGKEVIPVDTREIVVNVNG